MALVTMTGKARVNVRKVKKKMQQGNFESLGKAGAFVKGVARRSIRRSPRPSMPGKPIHTRKGKAKRALTHAVEKQTAGVVVGPAASKFLDLMRKHEHGGMFKIKEKKTLKGPYWQTRDENTYGILRLREGGLKGNVYARLTSAEQIERSKLLTQQANEARGKFNLAAQRFVARYPRRAVMVPALDKARPRLARFWAGSLKK